MMQLLKKSAFVGLGLAVMSTSAIKRIAQKLSDESNLSEEEGRKLYEDLLAESEKSKANLRRRVDDTVRSSIEDMDLATAEDIDSINRRLDMIDEKLTPKPKTEIKETEESDFVYSSK